MKKRVITLSLSLILTLPFLCKLAPVNSQNGNDYYSKANAMLISGEYNKAISLYNEAIKQKPKSADAYMGLGIAYKAKGDYNSAYNATVKAISLKPNYYQSYYNLGLILESMHRNKEAINAYEKFLKEVPGADRFSDVKQRIAKLKRA